MILAAPGVLRRTVAERIADVNAALCGLPWEEAMTLRPQMLRALGLVEVVDGERETREDCRSEQTTYNPRRS